MGWLAAVLLLPAAGLADHEHHKAEGAASAKPAAANSPEGKGAPSRDDKDDDDKDDKDEGPPPVVNRSPAQAEFRGKLLAREHDLVGKQYGHPGEHDRREARLAIGQHWRWVMRLARIRELAEDAHDAATVKAVDDILAKIDAKLTARMEKMRAKSESPTVAASAGSKIGLAKPAASAAPAASGGAK
jgi:hypothetical protein